MKAAIITYFYVLVGKIIPAPLLHLCVCVRSMKGSSGRLRKKWLPHKSSHFLCARTYRDFDEYTRTNEWCDFVHAEQCAAGGVAVSAIWSVRFFLRAAFGTLCTSPSRSLLWYIRFCRGCSSFHGVRAKFPCTVSRAWIRIRCQLLNIFRPTICVHAFLTLPLDVKITNLTEICH